MKQFNKNNKYKYNIAIIPGDGIGPEVVNASLKVIRKALILDNILIKEKIYDWGSNYYKNNKLMRPKDGLEKLKKHDAIFFGAVGDEKIADDIKIGGSQEYGGVGGGVLRRSLNALDITPKQLSDYQFIRKPLRTLEEIVNSLSRKDADGSYIRDKYKLTSRDAKFVQQNFQKIEAGRKSLNSWLKESEKILGKNLFKQTLGPVNFEHSIAKGLGSAYKYLPRDYLLRGSYTPEAFNLAKRDVFDKPLMNLMKKFTQTGKPLSGV